MIIPIYLGCTRNNLGFVHCSNDKSDILYENDEKH